MEVRTAWLQGAAALVVLAAAAACAPGGHRGAEPAAPFQEERGNAGSPIHVDSLVWTPEWKLDPADSALGGGLGSSVAALGETVVLGAPNNGAGAACVFARNGTTWQHQWLPFPGAESNSRIGSAVAMGAGIAGSDDTLVVGAKWTNATAGAAYVFTGSATSWSPGPVLLASDPASSDQFGTSVAVSGDTIVVGAIRGNLVGSGAAYVFMGMGTAWSGQQRLASPNAVPNDFFGYSVRVWGDIAVVGAPGNAAVGVSSPTLPGVAYVFVRSGTSWEEAQVLSGLPQNGAQFGTSLGMSEDRIVVGAPGEIHEGYYGAVYVFVRSGPTWALEQRLVASDGQVGTQFGFSVAVSGGTIAVGTRPTTMFNGGMTQGSAYVFTQSGSTWNQEPKLHAPDATDDEQFGNAVAVTEDAIFVGAVNDAPLGLVTGAGYVFELRRTNGDACQAADQCESGACADGVCCDVPCSDPCDVCAASLGAVIDGTCTNVAGTSGSPSCGPILCDGTSAVCPKTCASDDGCASGFRCAEGGACEPGGASVPEGSYYTCEAGPQGVDGRPACLVASLFALAALAARSRRRRR